MLHYILLVAIALTVADAAKSQETLLSRIFIEESSDVTCFFGLCMTNPRARQRMPSVPTIVNGTEVMDNSTQSTPSTAVTSQGQREITVPLIDDILSQAGQQAPFKPNGKTKYKCFLGLCLPMGVEDGEDTFATDSRPRFEATKAMNDIRIATEAPPTLPNMQHSQTSVDPRSQCIMGICLPSIDTLLGEVMTTIKTTTTTTTTPMPEASTKLTGGFVVEAQRAAARRRLMRS